MAKRILLIDDDKDDAEIFQEALNEADATVIFDYIDDGLKAMDKLLQNSHQMPDVVFLDINMPAISGWDLLRQLKEHEVLQKIPVIMYSTSSRPREAMIAADLGAAAFMTKPHNYGELRVRLKEVIGGL